MSSVQPPVQLPNIHPSSWEHPTDRAALGALQKIPGFDGLLRKVIGAFGEANVRMLFQASAIKVGPTQYPELHEALVRVCGTLDTDVPDLYVSQGPYANAGAVGVDHPFIVLNSSLIELGTSAEVDAVLGHEVGHIMSEHALYRTLLFLLMRLTLTRSPLISRAMMPIMLALLEWNRKAEISCDRAGLLAVQDPDASIGVLGVLAGGIRGEDHALNLEAFIEQSDEYRDTEGLSSFFRFMNMLGQTHPFAVVRVAELRNWIESGEYHEIIAGNYRTTADDPDLAGDIGTAASNFSKTAGKVFEDTEEYLNKTLGRFVNRVEEAFNSDGNVTPEDPPGSDDDDPLADYMDDWPVPQ